MKHKSVNFYEVQLNYFFVVAHVFGFITWKPLSNPRFTPVFSFKSFLILAFTFRSSIHFELIFVYVEIGLSLVLTGETRAWGGQPFGVLRKERRWPVYCYGQENGQAAIVSLCGSSGGMRMCPGLWNQLERQGAHAHCPHSSSVGCVHPQGSCRSPPALIGSLPLSYPQLSLPRPHTRLCGYAQSTPLKGEVTYNGQSGRGKSGSCSCRVNPQSPRSTAPQLNLALLSLTWRNSLFSSFPVGFCPPCP